MPITGGQTYLLTPFGDQTPTLQSGGFGLGSPVLASLLVPSLLPAQILLPRGLGPRTSQNQPLPSTSPTPQKCKDSSTFPCTPHLPQRGLKSSALLLIIRKARGVIYPDRLALLSANIHRSINRPKTQLAFNYSGLSQIFRDGDRGKECVWACLTVAPLHSSPPQAPLLPSGPVCSLPRSLLLFLPSLLP